MKKYLLFIILFPLVAYGFNENIIWKAQWIAPPNNNVKDYGVYLFRNTFELNAVPDNFLINVSADNRYRLFINGQAVAFGPARGDLNHWNYETIDINKYLKKGKNTIAAQVHNAGAEKPMAQVTSQTAFILQGPDEYHSLLNTGEAKWSVIKDEGFRQIKLKWWEWAHGWYAIGGSDEFDASKHPWGWEYDDFIEKNWLKPAVIPQNNWKLIPRNIPLLEEKVERSLLVRSAEGITVSDDFLTGKIPLIIPKNTKASIIFDNQHLTEGFPEITVEKGKESEIKITYAESPFTPQGKKPNRNEIKGNLILGVNDIFHPDGGQKRFFRPFWYRTFRYIKMEIITKGEELVINDFHNLFTAYPFVEKAKFESSETTLKPIWDAGWRTARLCAFETYMDCPYYEQLNYEGDTRIQSLISLYISGDDRLMRSALEHFHNSRMASGLLQAAYPYMGVDKGPIIIPTYSLYFVDMVHDYYMYRGDTSFLKHFLPTIDASLHWFDQKIDATTGLLGPSPDWNYIDWTYEEMDDKIAKKGQSGIYSLIYADAMDRAAELYKAYGEKQKAEDLKQRSEKIKTAVKKLCFDEKRKLFADTPDKTLFSEQMNCMAIITGIIPEGEQTKLMQQVLKDTSLIKCSSYFKFYFFTALKKSGLGNDFLNHLNLWKNMLKAGLTTFSEIGNTSTDRSDCHAWSAHPGMEFLSVIAGIEPESPAFKRIKIQPSPCGLNWFKSEMPHPDGIISLEMKKIKSGGYTADINIPGRSEGNFIWNGKIIPLKSGHQQLILTTTKVK